MKSIYDLKKNYVPVEVEKLDTAELQWFRDAKFGMFIHFGLYSLLGRGEWVMFNERISTSEYAKLADRFTLESFDAKQWAKAAKAAGMKYMVLTARHHDGFSLFDSKVSQYNSVNSAARRDVVAEYVDACRNEGLKVGIYYSPMDWRFPGYFFPEMYLDSALEMRDQCREQLRELMTNYGKIDLLWFDGEWLAHGGIKFGGDGWYRDADYGNDPIYFKVNYFWESEKVLSMIRELQPGIVINNRFGWEGDIHDRERRMGQLRTDKPWESGDCLAKSWGWIPNMPMLSLRELVKKLVSSVVRDGNYLLNLGPMGNGAFEQRYIQRIKQAGDWLHLYGESIYGTRGGPIAPAEWGGTTYKGSSIYLHITEWVDDVLILPWIKNKITSFECITSDGSSVIQTDTSIQVSVPMKERHPLDTIIKLNLDSHVEWEGVIDTEQDIYGLADGLKKRVE